MLSVKDQRYIPSQSRPSLSRLIYIANDTRPNDQESRPLESSQDPKYEERRKIGRKRSPNARSRKQRGADDGNLIIISSVIYIWIRHHLGQQRSW